MSVFFKGQVFNDLMWATPLPAMVKIGTEQARLRARGTCSIGIKNFDLADEKVSDPNAVEPCVLS